MFTGIIQALGRITAAQAAGGDLRLTVDASALAEPGLRLMSQSQYVDTINRIFGQDIAVKARFAPVKREEGLLAVGAGKAVLTSGALDPLDAVARAVAAQVVNAEHRDYLLPCKPVAAKYRSMKSSCGPSCKLRAERCGITPSRYSRPYSVNLITRKVSPSAVAPMRSHFASPALPARTASTIRATSALEVSNTAVLSPPSHKCISLDALAYSAECSARNTKATANSPPNISTSVVRKISMPK